MRTKQSGFTLLELIVAIAILAMILSFAGVVFKISIESYRTAMANAEIMRKLRAITDQLNTDFKGIRKDAPLLIWFRQKRDNPSQRYDQIMFFPIGDFQSIQLYTPGPASAPVFGTKIPAPIGTPIRGNLARIYYGQANSRDSQDNEMKDPFNLPEEERVLTKSQHILTADPNIFHWFADFNNFSGREIIHDRYPNNDFYEHDRLSLSEWKAVGRIPYEEHIIPACFDERPLFDIYDPNTFHKLLCERVSNFKIQWAYWDTDQYRWFPSDNIDGLAATNNDSHFLWNDPDRSRRNQFGVSFNIPGMQDRQDWRRIEDGYVIYRWPRGYGSNERPLRFSPGFYPNALKFTFTLYDSKGIIENGRLFTHIVYIGD